MHLSGPRAWRVVGRYYLPHRSALSRDGKMLVLIRCSLMRKCPVYIYFCTGLVLSVDDSAFLFPPMAMSAEGRNGVALVTVMMMINFACCLGEANPAQAHEQFTLVLPWPFGCLVFGKPSTILVCCLNSKGRTGMRQQSRYSMQFHAPERRVCESDVCGEGYSTCMYVAKAFVQACLLAV